MNLCKGCGGSQLVKNGRNSKGKQRYRCKLCLRTFCEGDDRLKHTMDKRLRVIQMYLEGVGIRSIERLENVSNPLIIYWIRHFSGILRKELQAAPLPNDVKDIEILELDELFTYCKKNSTKSMFGLLLTETETKLLTLK